jgi:hypothetical protein
MNKKRSQLLRKIEAKKQLDNTLKRTQTVKSDITTDSIHENERGTILFNSAQFNKKALLPTDPPAFTDTRGGYVVDIRYFQCPPGWEWVSDWMIDMNGAVDEQGWSYNSSFLSKADSWKVSVQQVGNITCVRRRRWTRMRRLQGFSSPELNIQKTGMEEIIGMIQRKRSDREKLLVLKEYLIKQAITDPVLYTTILQELDYAHSLLDACMLIAPLGKDHPELIRKCAAMLSFGSDKITFLKATNLEKSQYNSVLE